MQYIACLLCSYLQLLARLVLNANKIRRKYIKDNCNKILNDLFYNKKFNISKLYIFIY